MDLWIAVTLSAAFFQTLRFMLHKVLSMGALTSTGSTFARFAYALPPALLFTGIYLWSTGQGWPQLGWAFWIYAWIGALGQILATICVVAIFRQRNFAVGITFKKTEVIQTAILGAVMLGEVISPAGWAAILIGLVGVLLLSDTPGLSGGLMRRVANRAVALGLASGFFFAFSAVGYRAASLEIAGDDPVLRASVTYVCVVVSQVIAMSLWLRVAEPGQIAAVWNARKVAVWLGLTSMAGSLSWFIAFTLQTAAYVQALGQVELLFSLMASVLFFKESVSRRELGGIGFLGLSILVLVLVL
ncbi:DMT family transporter [Salipiger thiooxidans]|uniref:DMT family transporter n=1 Tax=Salipiger thiooxidans TaxID=282683 RepID=UPI001CD24E5E|nr:DMT family transporter [Salipiger thiooxidans]MBR9838239.1 EamA family transporter [Paracoccaceae bacterium]MCA0846718.1 DMT family transporter [Salipiger thiooxidans]